MTEYFKKCCLIIFTRNLIPGNVNTQLVKEAGEEQAFRIYGELVNRTRSVTAALPVARHIYYDRFTDGQDAWQTPAFRKFLQEGNDAGARLENAFRNAFDEGFRKVVVIGCDYAELTTKHLEEAFLSLKIIEFCIGPDDKGGYYLLGMNQFQPSVLRNKDFDSPSLAKATIREIGNLRQALYKLPVLKAAGAATVFKANL